MLNGGTWKKVWAAALPLSFLIVEWNRNPVENKIFGCVFLTSFHIDN